MGRKYRTQTSRYEEYKHNGKKLRKGWRRRRIERIAHQKNMKRKYRDHYYRSILGYLFAKKRRRGETLREYRLRLINLELLTFIIILLIIIFFLLPR